MPNEVTIHPQILAFFTLAVGVAVFVSSLLARIVDSNKPKSNGNGSFTHDDRKDLVRIAVAVERSSEAAMRMVEHLREEIREAREFRDQHQKMIVSHLDEFRCRATCTYEESGD